MSALVQTKFLRSGAPPKSGADRYYVRNPARTGSFSSRVFQNSRSCRILEMSLVALSSICGSVGGIPESVSASLKIRNVKLKNGNLILREYPLDFVAAIF